MAQSLEKMIKTIIVLSYIITLSTPFIAWLFYYLGRRSTKKDNVHITKQITNEIRQLLESFNIDLYEKQKEYSFIEKKDKINEKADANDIKNIIVTYGRLSNEAYQNIQRSMALRLMLKFEEFTDEMISNSMPYFFQTIVNSYYVYQDAKSALLKIQKDIGQDESKKELKDKIERSIKAINVYDPLVKSLWQDIIKEGIPEIQQQRMNWEGKRFKEKLKAFNFNQK